MRRKQPYFLTIRFNPEAPADWRWQRAMHLVSSGQYASPKRDDAMTIRAVRLLRGLRRAATEKALARVREKDPHSFAALAFRQAAGQPEFELRARLLAREPYRAIARRLRLSPETVQAFADLFFDVAGRDYAPGYVHHVVVGCRPEQIPSIPALALLAAFHHGPVMIEPWLDYLEHGGESHDLSTREGLQRETIELFVVGEQIGLEEANLDLVKKFPWMHRLGQEIRLPRSVEDVLREKADRLLRDLLPEERPTKTPETPREHQEGFKMAVA